MRITYTPIVKKRPKADLLVVPFWQGKKAEAACSLSLFSSEIQAVLRKGDFQGTLGETCLVYTSKKPEGRLLLLGLGKKREASAETMRKAASSSVSVCRQKKWERLNFFCPEDSFYHSALAEGFLLAGYEFQALKHDSLKEGKVTSLKAVCLVGPDSSFAKECKRKTTIVQAVNFARDLVNGNADDITPQKLCEVAMGMKKEHSFLKVTILGKRELTKEGLGLLLAVNRASFRDPALIILEYKGDPSSKEYTAIVGKGITYDTGGLNLKPGSSMETMKDDMSGAAAVLGTIQAVASLQLGVNVLGVIPTTENAIGSKSYKPGDVYRSYSGKMVEIVDTDAEGRLVLADAISYVQDRYPVQRLIDLATLTGAIVVALGEHVSGLFSNHDGLAKELFEAGEISFERVWRMPMYAEYKEALRSTLADIKNCGDRKASSITAAIFIESFIKNIPWAHLDIAGTAYLSKPAFYHTTPATGVGVRLLVEYFTRRCKKSSS